MRQLHLSLLFLCTLLLGSSFAQSSELNGVAIANIINYPSYKRGFTPGKLVRYKIERNFVTGVDTLPVDAGHSPVINKSGTFFAYLTNSGTNRSLVIRSLRDPSKFKSIPVAKDAIWLWWGIDGSFYYSTNYLRSWTANNTNYNEGGQYHIRKLTLRKVNNQVEIDDRLYCKLMAPAQGGFIGMDGYGKKLGYSGDGNKLTLLENPPFIPSAETKASFSGGWVMDGDTNNYAIQEKRAIPGFGCGWSISVSGDYYTQWIGGHATTPFFRWNNPNTAWATATFKLMNSTWAKFRDSDVESKLEISLDSGATWSKNPIGVMGQDNIFSVNSDYWHLSEIGISFLANSEGDYTNLIALNARCSTAVNITKIMPHVIQPVTAQNSVYRGQLFRGIDFSKYSYRHADRGSLWISDTNDVYPPLRKMVAQPDSDHTYWSSLVDLPVSNKERNTASSHAKRTSDIVNTPRNISLPYSDAYSIRIIDISGRAVAHLQGTGNSVSLPRLNSGSYIIRVRQRGQVINKRTMIP